MMAKLLFYTIQGFLAAGLVYTIVGISEYQNLVQKYKLPIVVTGFEPIDLLQGIYIVVKQLEEGRGELENRCSGVVKSEGNLEPLKIIQKVLKVCDPEWREIGLIANSGYKLNEAHYSTRWEHRWSSLR
jgi:hydrogenase expression/formation protein HypD